MRIKANSNLSNRERTRHTNRRPGEAGTDGGKIMRERQAEDWWNRRSLIAQGLMIFFGWIAAAAVLTVAYFDVPDSMLWLVYLLAAPLGVFGIYALFFGPIMIWAGVEDWWERWRARG
jgi:hypothetical protein